MLTTVIPNHPHQPHHSSLTLSLDAESNGEWETCATIDRLDLPADFDSKVYTGMTAR